MKDWKKPSVITVSEKELKGIIVAGACSMYWVCGSSWNGPIREIKSE